MTKEGISQASLVDLDPARNLQDLIGQKLSGDRAIAAEILDFTIESESDKISFFKYFIWQQWGGSALKELGDIREDSFVSLVNEINDDQQKRMEYEEFYGRFQEEVILRLFRSGASLIEASEETEISLSKAMDIRWEAFEAGNLRLQPIAQSSEETRKLLETLGILDLSIFLVGNQDRNLRVAIAELELMDMSEKAIASTLGIGRNTVHNYLTNLVRHGFENKRARQDRAIKEMLLKFTKEFSAQYPDKPVRIWYLIRDKKTNVDYRRLVRCYEELSLANELPPLSREHTRL